MTDSTNGEALVFCNVFLKELNTGASTNERRLYLIKSIPSSKEYQVTISYVGYKTKNLSVFIKPDVVTELDVELIPLSVELQTIEKVGEKIIRENTTDISLETISVKEIEILPKGVETDIFRSLQYIPGVSTTGDATAKFYVRGGSGDQNLILLNGVEIYNPFHSPLAKDTLTALRHLREIVERHEHHWEGNGDFTGNYWACWGCNRRVKRGTWCPVIRALAPDYAPQALK